MDKKRHLESKINKLIKMFPAIAIIGARQTGKSTLVKQVAGDEFKYYDLENPEDYRLIANDPVDFFRRTKDKVIIDEAQQYPELFEVLRGVIDQNRNRAGHFILTGSSSPKIVKGLSESLAGRIATVELSPFTMTEYYEKPLSLFYETIINAKTADDFNCLYPSLELAEVYEHWFLGGYPEPRIKGEDFTNIWKNQYFQDYIKRDIAALFPKINSHNFRRFVDSLVFQSGTSVNKSDIARAIEVSSVTVKEYLEIIHETFLWRNLESYEKNPLKKVQKMPKGFFRDSGILHHLLKLPDIDSLLVHPSAGLSFESFVIEEIIRGLNSLMETNIDYYFYRTKDKSEIDLIIESPHGTIPVEIKLGSKVQKRSLVALSNFIKETKAPFGLLINSSKRVEILPNQIVQIPVSCL